MAQERFLKRRGAVGALMDEYERAVADLHSLLAPIQSPAYERVMDSQTTDEDCRSIQTILSHVVSSGYSYADYLREHLQIAPSRPVKRLLSRSEVADAIDTMVQYTVSTLQDHWEMPEDRMTGMRIESRWNVVYDMEQMLEHAIVHVLRHRRQIQKFLLRMGGTHPSGA